MQRIVENRSRPQREVSVEARRAAFERKRLAIEFDIAQGELASDEENPWNHRIELLTEALDTVREDQEALKEVPKEPYAPVPPIPVTDISVDKTDAIAVAFTIAGHGFRYEEVLDWAERGHTVASPELRVVACPVAEIIPDSIPAELREPLTRHLTDSIAVFATDLRDRALDDEPMPEGVTLADLARECPACGGWADWHGRCEACTRRKGQAQALRMEQNRLLQERANEAEERHRLAERLPLARRRLRDLEADIAAFEQQHGT
ncbi:MAG TPA: hypothetical protein VNZ55_14145 [Thermomicrobiales bacterium]|nr:hypothetical protein [Thermomicrobiales bacterium]